jgi:hypothetical protein
VVLIPVNRLSSEFSQLDSPLLRVHWQRIILDEGHHLGATSTITAKLSMACALKAGGLFILKLVTRAFALLFYRPLYNTLYTLQRICFFHHQVSLSDCLPIVYPVRYVEAHSRWVMTGTPTPATLKGAGVGHLQPLLAFLRQPPFGSSQQLWTQTVQKPLEAAGARGVNTRGGGGDGKGGGRGKGSGGSKGGRGGRGKDRGYSGGGGKGKATTGEGAGGDDANGGRGGDVSPAYDGAAAAAAAVRSAAAAHAGEEARAEAAARLGLLLRRTAIRTLKSDIRLPPVGTAVQVESNPVDP